MRWILVPVLTAGLICITLTSGCGNGSGVDPDDYGGTIDQIIVPAYMPYVEEVAFPDPVYANEDFTATMRLSSALEPRLLSGQMLDKLHVAGPSFNPARPTVALLPMWMRDDFPQLGIVPETAEYRYSRPLNLPAGEWFIGVQTAKTRELGGVFVQYAPLDSLSSWDEYYVDTLTGRSDFVEYRLYPVTVVERPSSGAGVS